MARFGAFGYIFEAFPTVPLKNGMTYYFRSDSPLYLTILTLYGHMKSAEQRIIIQQYGDWYTGR